LRRSFADVAGCKASKGEREEDEAGKEEREDEDNEHVIADRRVQFRIAFYIYNNRTYYRRNWYIGPPPL